jgi:uncharacterized protein involved in type VI secretion and phage assembly
MQEQKIDKGMPVIVTGKVTDNVDPEHLGRVKVKYEWRDDNDESDWIRILTPMGGNEMGLYFIPEVDDEVVVAFQNGDINAPIILGSLWSSVLKPPDSNQDGKNNLRMIKSRSGHTIILDDKDGAEKISVIDKSSNNSMVIDTANNTITITSDQDIALVAKKGKITLDAKELEFKSSQATSVTAGTDFTVSASSGKAAIDAGQFDLKGSTQGSIDGGATLTVKGTQLDLKGTAQATLDGGANLTAKASGMATVEASGIMTIKGAMVMIN